MVCAKITDQQSRSVRRRIVGDAVQHIQRWQHIMFKEPETIQSSVQPCLTMVVNPGGQMNSVAHTNSGKMLLIQIQPVREKP